MTRRAIEDEDPDRLYTVTGGRSRTDAIDLDLITLIVSESDPVAGMQSEHVRILNLCRGPAAVVEIAAELGMPVSVVKILLADLIDMGKVSARNPGAAAQLPDGAFLKKVLVGLHNL